MRQRIFRKTTDYIVLGILVLVFGYFALFCEARELSDSFQYLNQMVSREPVYALLLKGFTAIWGEQYLRPLAIFQNGLAVIAIYWIYVRLTKLFSFPALMEWGVFAALLAPHLITPVAAKSGMIITNSVLTEGIAISLYYIWIGMIVTLLLKQYEKKQNVALVVSGVFSMILSMIRGQFLVCIAVWFLTGIVVFFLERDYKRMVLVLLGCLLLVAGKSYLTKVYHYAESGLYVATTSGKPMMLANILYLSDVEDGKDIENARLYQAYENMVQQVEELQLSIDYAPDTIIGTAQFHEYGHETINFEIIDPEIEAVVEEIDGVMTEDYEHQLYLIDEYAARIIGAVLPNIMPEFIQNYFVIAALGFVRSVAIDRFILPIYAVVIYLIAIIMALILWLKNHRSKSAYFMILTLVLICGNVFGTSLMIQCISRYMIYNLPFFYIAGMAMLIELWSRRKTENGI